MKQRSRLAVLVGATVALALAGCSAPGTTTSGASPNATSNSTVASRSVTTGPGIPDAHAIDDATLASVGSGWVLTFFDTGAYDKLHNPVVGPRLMYLISPAGDRYQVAYFSQIRGADVLAWNVEQDKVFMRFNGSELGVFDLVSGRQAPTWTPCGVGPADVRVEPRTDGNWQIRGACSGAQLDGVYADDGSPVNDASFIPASLGSWATNVGSTTVTYSMSDGTFTATAAPGSQPVALQLPAGVDSCRPLANGRGATVTAECTSAAGSSVWEIDSAGGPAVPVASADEVAGFSSALADSGVGSPTTVVNTCVVGGAEAVTVHALGRAVGIAGGANLEPVWLHPHQQAEYCWGSSGTVGLFSSQGSLWTYDTASKTTVPLVEVDALTNPLPTVGVALTRSIIAP